MYNNEATLRYVRLSINLVAAKCGLDFIYFNLFKDRLDLVLSTLCQCCMNVKYHTYAVAFCHVLGMFKH